MIEFVTTPTEQWLRGEVERCNTQLLIASPYVGGWLSALHSSVSDRVRRVLLTRADLRDFASGASDLGAVCNLAANGTEVVGAYRLHAKVYVIDESCGLVTSANATFSGMRGNLECGIVIRDTQSVRKAADLVLSAFGAKEKLQRWSFEELDALREPVRQIKETLPPKMLAHAIDERWLPNIDLDNPIGKTLRAHLAGWTALALEGLQMQSPIFTLDAFAAVCAPMVRERYPKNQNVRAKLPQQLQRLRDLGLIEFLGGGRYRRSSENS